MAVALGSRNPVPVSFGKSASLSFAVYPSRQQWDSALLSA
jgi:hypothetical protein